MKFFAVALFAVLLGAVACQDVNDDDFDIEALINDKFRDIIPDVENVTPDPADVPEIPDVPAPDSDETPEIPDGPPQRNDVAKKIHNLFVNSAQDQNVLVHKLQAIINNGITQAVDGTEEAILGCGGLARAFTAPLKAVVSAISSAAQGINQKIAEVVSVPVGAAINTAEQAVQKAADVATTQIQRLANCNGAQPELEAQGYQKLIDCIPNHVVDTNTIGHLLDDVYDYVDFITKVPQSAKSCIGNGLIKGVPCAVKLGAQIPVKSVIIGPRLGKDGIQIGLSYTNFGIEVAQCFTSATVAVAKDAASNGVNIRNCLSN